MDLEKVVFANNQWLSVDLIEGHTSFIWTSRFIPFGDFEYRTHDIERVYGLIQKGDYVKNNSGDDEVCIVNQRFIEIKDDGPPELVIKGRSFESILQSRAMWDSNVRPDYGSFNAWFVMGTLISKTLITPSQPQDAVPRVNIGFSITGNSGPYNDEKWPFDYKALTAYDNMKSIMERANIGIHCVHRAAKPDEELFMIIHDGTDRTMGQTEVEPVILSTDAGHINDARYAEDDTDYRNVAYINSPIGFRIYPPTASMLTGASRRVLQVNADDLTEVPAGMTAIQALDARGALELSKYKNISLFDGEIGPESPYKYQRDYYLGDKVTVLGDYGPPSTMQVTEYIKSSSPSGDLEYPTLAQVI